MFKRLISIIMVICILCNGVLFANNIKRTEFVKTSFKEGRLMRNELKDIIFDECDLCLTEIIDTSLADIDLSSTKIEGILIQLDDIKGCKVNIYESEIKVEPVVI